MLELHLETHVTRYSAESTACEKGKQWEQALESLWEVLEQQCEVQPSGPSANNIDAHLFSDQQMKKYPQKHFTAEAYRCKDSQNAW